MNDNNDEVDEYSDDYQLIDPQSFEEFSEMIGNGTASNQHHDEFYLRLINEFCGCVESDTVPDRWVMLALCKAFTKITMGGRWEDEFPLPWTKRSLIWTDKELRDLSLFRQIRSVIKASPDFDVTSTIREIADKNNTSYETARAAYYKFKPK